MAHIKSPRGMSIFVMKRKNWELDKRFGRESGRGIYRFPASSCPGVGCWEALALLEAPLLRVNQLENRGGLPWLEAGVIRDSQPEFCPDWAVPCDAPPGAKWPPRLDRPMRPEARCGGTSELIITTRDREKGLVEAQTACGDVGAAPGRRPVVGSTSPSGRGFGT